MQRVVGVLKPLNTALPMTVKTKTGSSDMVTLLNRFGHGLSYKQIEELETCMARKQLANQADGIFIPSTIQAGVFTTFCWDNNDILEETTSMSGADTIALYKWHYDSANC